MVRVTRRAEADRLAASAILKTTSDPVETPDAGSTVMSGESVDALQGQPELANCSRIVAETGPASRYGPNVVVYEKAQED